MKLTLLLGLLLVVQLGRAQVPASTEVPTRQRVFGVQLGINHLRVLDRNTSSLVYTGYLPGVQLHYEGLKNGNRIRAQFRVNRGAFYAEAYPNRTIAFRTEDVYGKIDSVLVPVRGTNTLLGLSLAYSRQIPVTEQLNLDLGAELADDLYYPQGFVQPGLMNMMTLGPHLQMSYAPKNRHLFTVGISVPLVALVSRSNYNNTVSQPHDPRVVGFFDKGTRWDSLGEHRQIDLLLGYQWQMGHQLNSGLHYRYRILKNESPRDLTIQQNELALSIQFVR